MNRRPPRRCSTNSSKPGVKLLVDVRAVAASRRPGFSKNQLAAGLDERGISYLHLRGLGTPKDGRDAARSGKFDAAAQDLREASEDAAGQGRTRRAVGAGQEIRAGLHSLLRARSPALPPAVDRRDHRGPRRGEGGESGRAAGVKPSFPERAPHSAQTRTLAHSLRALHPSPASRNVPSIICTQAAADMRGDDSAVLLCGRASAAGSAAPCRRPARCAASIRRPARSRGRRAAPRRPRWRCRWRDLRTGRSIPG